MTTHESQHSRSEDVTTRTTNIQRDMYRLLAAIFASEHFPHEPDDTEDPLGLAQLASQFEDDEIRRLLGTIAAAVQPTLIGDTGIANFPCGLLTEASGMRHLTVREACDKAVHAKTIVTDVELDGRRAVRRLPIMLLEGMAPNGEGWTARLELVPLARLLAAL